MTREEIEKIMAEFEQSTRKSLIESILKAGISKDTIKEILGWIA